jgi:predicted dehydrogenase
MDKKIRLGFIGCGYMGQIAHIHNYAQLTDECELVAVADMRTGLARKVADRYGIAEIYPDHQTMLAQADIDAVVAIMGYAHHHAMIPDVLNAGKHVLTEKPMGCQAENARAWKEIADEKGVLYLVGYMKRWDLGTLETLRVINEWKDSGEYGALNYVRCTMAGTDWEWVNEKAIQSDEQVASGPSAEGFPGRFTSDEADYYNTQINFYVHQVNLLRYLLGEDYDLTYTHPSGFVLTATTESGIPVTLEMSQSRINRTWDEVYTFSFEKGDIQLSLPAPLRHQINGEVVIRRNVGETYETITPNIAPPSWSFMEQARGFLACIREGKLPFDSTGEAIRDLEIFEQQVDLMRSARER